MTEQFRLTNEAQNTYSKTMPEPGNGEAQKVQKSQEVPQKTEPVLSKREDKETGQIPRGLQDTESLRQEYLTITKFLGTQKGKEAEEFAASAQPRMADILEELQKRGIDTTELSKEARKEWSEEAKRRGPGTMPGVEQERSIFEGLTVSLELTDEEQRAIIASAGTQDLEDIRRLFEARRVQRNKLADYIDSFKREEAAKFFIPEQAWRRLDEAITKGEVERADAERYLGAILEEARRIGALRGLGRGEIQEIEEIKETTDRGSQERRNDLAAWIKKISPDIVTINPEYLRLLAEDRETAEMFLDKIISKPFSSPEDQYRLSFYADINLSGYLTEVAAINEQMLEEFNLKKEASLRFHEMNRTIISESGNPEAFLGMSRSVSHRHLQTATEIDGVERFRQLLETSYGRFYTKSDRLKQENFEPEIIAWATRKFYQEAGYVWNEVEGKWMYSGGEIIKGKFLDASGNPKHMEEWEAKRAIAFGRNIHAAFYRHSELISWSSIPKEWEEWLKSMPSETVVRVMGGLKFLTQRFKIGETGGGPQFVWRLLSKIEAGYRKLIKDKKISLTKIGKLDIGRDILPAGFMKAGGFDKGWRTLIAYLDTDVTRVNIPNVDFFHEDVREGVRQFVQEYGNEASLYKFLIKQEFFAKMLTSMGMEVEGVEIPPEAQATNFPEQAKLLQKVLIPLLGLSSKDVQKTSGPKYEFDLRDFNYNPNLDQINLSLGVFINGGWTNTAMKEILWRKSADFLPLRLGYMLSEAGVKGLPGYGNVRGENGNLFSDEFESKLLRAQYLRIEAQKNSRAAVSLDNFFAQAGLTPEEIVFVRRLQEFGRNNAFDLANISFPHIPFLDDAPFKNANYIDLGAEVFPRRIGGDFRAYAETNNALNTIIGDLGAPYEEFLKHVKEFFTSLQSPEGPRAAQDVVLPIVKTRFEMAKQWAWTKIPGLKLIREFMGLPTSELQKYFDTKVDSLSAAQLNSDAREVVATGSLRREKLPGEEKSQINDLLESTFAKWYHVLKEQTPGTILFIIFLWLRAFFGKLGGGK